MPLPLKVGLCGKRCPKKGACHLPEAIEIEIISEDNICEMVLLWFGKFKTCDRRATCFIKDKVFSYTNRQPKENIKILDYPLSYLYESNKAIIKAHLIDEVAQ
ncbi:MAG: hypothetical protein Athens101410_628 [Parcubacteria group bacterium Athens1014_10]|nr:MAG: hypothetical protein Athens101410_628 [Parcubacteria group bacterium Athens1014_10]TSD04814.1 MAG: hypothetical protein Athens071412_598 [Parcubacteria group bacterium Athens0714_12]